jgi:hypothetical protein
VFFERPISLTFLVLTGLLVLLLVAPSLRGLRTRAFDEPAA